MFFYIAGFLMSKLENMKIRYLSKKNSEAVNNGGGVIGGRAILSNPQNITIGKNSYINGGYIEASPNSKIIIGENCLISYEVHIRVGMHNYKNRSMLIREQGSREADVNIKNDVWIGFGVQIMPGVTIHDGCVIGAGAVVTKDTEPYGVYAGIPAKKIGQRIEFNIEGVEYVKRS